MKQNLIADLGDYLPYVDKEIALVTLTESLSKWKANNFESLTSRRYYRKYLYTDFIWGLIYAHKFLDMNIEEIILVRDKVDKIFGTSSGCLRVLGKYFRLPILRSEDEFMFIEIDSYLARNGFPRYLKKTYDTYLKVMNKDRYVRNTYFFYKTRLVIKCKPPSRRFKLLQLHKDNTNLFWGLLDIGETSIATELLENYRHDYNLATSYIDRNNYSVDLTIFCFVEMYVALGKYIRAKEVVDFVIQKSGYEIPPFILESIGDCQRLNLSSDAKWLDSSVDWIVAVFKLWLKINDVSQKNYIISMLEKINCFTDGIDFFKIYYADSKIRQYKCSTKGLSLVSKLDIVRKYIAYNFDEVVMTENELFMLEDR